MTAISLFALLSLWPSGLRAQHPRGVQYRAGLIGRLETAATRETPPKDCWLDEACLEQLPDARRPKPKRPDSDYFQRLMAASKPCLRTQPRTRVASVLAVKNQEDVLVDFLTYHIIVGVEHFFVYDNGSTDRTRMLLQPFVDRGFVTLELLPGCGVQRRAVNMGLAAAKKNNFSWALLTDVDEWIVPYEHGCVGTFARVFEGAVSIPHDPPTHVSEGNRSAFAIRLHWLIPFSPLQLVGSGLRSQYMDPILPLAGSIHSHVKLLANLKFVASLGRTAHDVEPDLAAIAKSRREWCMMDTARHCHVGHTDQEIQDDMVAHVQGAFLEHMVRRSFEYFVRKADNGDVFTCLGNWTPAPLPHLYNHWRTFFYPQPPWNCDEKRASWYVKTAKFRQSMAALLVSVVEGTTLRSATVADDSFPGGLPCIDRSALPSLAAVPPFPPFGDGVVTMRWLTLVGLALFTSLALYSHRWCKRITYTRSLRGARREQRRST